MAKKVSSGWIFNLEKVGNREAVKEPLGYKSSIQDVVVRNTGRRNLTQIEVLENVIHLFAYRILKLC